MLKVIMLFRRAWSCSRSMKKNRCMLTVLKAFGLRGSS
jgi:hypothetical protein